MTAPPPVSASAAATSAPVFLTAKKTGWPAEIWRFLGTQRGMVIFCTLGVAVGLFIIWWRK